MNSNIIIITITVIFCLHVTKSGNFENVNSEQPITFSSIKTHHSEVIPDLRRQQPSPEYKESSFKSLLGSRRRRRRTNQDVRFLVKNEVKSLTTSRLEFLDVPSGDAMKVSDLQLGNGYPLFDVLSRLMGHLQPSSFPLGLIEDMLHPRLPTYILLFETLKAEASILGWSFLWLLLALSLPCAIAAKFCCVPNSDIHRLKEYQSESSWNQNKTKILSTAFVHLLLLFLLFCTILMLLTNEIMSESSEEAPKATQIILKDVETFIEDTQMQISSLITSSMQITMDAVHRNLEGAEELLGEPLKRAIDNEIGIDSAIQELSNLMTATTELSSRVSDLLKDCREAQNMGKRLQESLMELSGLFTVARQGCLPRDQALCDTLHTTGINVSLRIEQLYSDKMLQQLKEIGQNEEFNRSVETARMAYYGLPRRVSLETSVFRAGIRNVLNKRRTELYKSVQALENASSLLTRTVRSASDTVYNAIKEVTTQDSWRWIIVLAICLVIILVWYLLAYGIPCGCNPNSKTVPFLQTGLGLSCILTLILWTFGTIAFLLASHGNTLICRPFHDQPKYTALQNFLNSKKLFHKDNKLLKYFLNDNNTFEIATILSNCEKNRTVYSTFHLNRTLNIELLTNPLNWSDFNQLTRNFSINLTDYEILNPPLKYQLHQLSTASQMNFEEHKTGMFRLVTNKDLNSLADQIEHIAKQLHDPQTAEEMKDLAHRTNNVIAREVEPLKKLRDAILYRMAALELLMVPLNKQTNLSLARMKTVQYFITNQGTQIARKVSYDYVKEIENAFMKMHRHILKTVTENIGRCGPLWDCFHATRTIICKTMIDPLNGFSFACFYCISLLLCLAPLTIRAILRYKEEDGEDSLNSITHRRARNGLLIDEEGTWATPPGSFSEETPRFAESSAWTTPSIQPPASVVAIPRIVEPRATHHSFTSSMTGSQSLKGSSRILDAARLINATARIPEPPIIRIKSPLPRILQGATKAVRNRYESMKLIERIGRLTPKSWL